MSAVLLGYQLGVGNPVAIPISHMVIVGQSQRAGKTTTLEACAFRCWLQVHRLPHQARGRIFPGCECD